MTRAPLPPATRYVLAVAAAVAGVAVRWLLDPWLGDRVPLVTLYAAVAATVWVAGLGPAVLCAALGFLACTILFMPPRGELGLSEFGNMVSAAAYVLSTSIIIAIGVAMRRAQRMASEQRETLRITLASIGDAVIATDVRGQITWLNPVAETLTGWSVADATGRPLMDVFRIVNEDTRARVESPAVRALREGVIVGLANHTLLISRDGTERPIDDSAAPIRDVDGEITGCVLVFRDVGERRAIDKELERRRRELDDFFENATISLHWAGVDGRILRANKAELQMLGYTAAEYVGRNVAEFHVDPQVIESITRRLAAGEEIHAEPARLRAKDGSIKDVLIHANVLWQDDRFVHSRSFTQDVTDRRRSEVGLSRLAAIVSDSDDAIVSKALDGTIQSWNAGAERLYGWRPNEAIGRHIDLIVPEDRLDEERTILERLRRGERIEHFETVRLARDGRLIDVSVTISPLRDASGRIVGASKVARDITERKRAATRAQQLLRESEERFRRLADAAPVLIWTSGTDGGRNWFNKQWLEFVGRPLAQELGQGWAASVHEDDLPRTSAAFRQALDARQPFGFEYRLRRHDGSFRWVFDNGIPQFGPNGSFTGYVGSCIDVNDRKETEQTLRETDRRKDHFLATLAHELRNPLSPVRNSLEVMKRAGEEPHVLEQARETMDRQIAHMERLIDDLMDVSRITRDRLELRKTRIDLASVVQHAVETSRPLFEQHGHRVTVRLLDQPIALEGDLVRLAQVFGNLLNNAAKYTPAGGSIELAAERQGRNVVVTVSDTGIGISPDVLPRIFDMFMQEGRAFDVSRSGMGIGLTLVRQLVEMHGGTVEAASGGAGKGSVFTVRLPALPETEANTAPPEPPTAAGAGQAPVRRILVVDDNVDSAESMALLLGMSGHRTEVAHDGLEAVAAAERFRPELVLLDLGLPILSGYEVCRRIRAQPWGGGIVIVALTGWGQDEDRRKSSDAGFDGHMVKPANHAALFDLVANLPRSQESSA